MKKILFVEDDVLVARIYCQKLAEAGFEVMLAEDGLQAMKQLPGFKPDLVVLDLLMPKMTGVDVLKFMRQHPDLESVRVVVFTNSFLSGLVEQVQSMKVEEALIKADVTPARLAEVIHRILATPGQAPADPRPEPAATRVPAPSTAGLAGPDVNEGEVEFQARMRREFLERIPDIFKGARQTCREFVDAEDLPAQQSRLEELKRKIGFLTQMTAMAGYQRLAELSSALEALFFELVDQPALINDSSRHTIVSTVAFLADSLDRAELVNEPRLEAASVLVVDDDAVSNRAVVLSLSRAKLSTASLTDPLVALKRLQQTGYDLLLVDIDMPGMDGVELCEQVRRLPLHRHTPVVFVTNLTDFKTRARAILSGGNDLITKPILPSELCVKAITQVLKSNSSAGRG
jgi:CheY-like chemotaxis protein